MLKSTPGLDANPSGKRRYSSTRVSFIGHSAGGLIIRRCLQEQEMAPGGK